MFRTRDALTVVAGDLAIMLGGLGLILVVAYGLLKLVGVLA